MRNIKESLYWNPHKILTYNAMFNMIVGGRGTGKTFGALRKCIKHYIKTKRLFIYLRRYDTDLGKKEKLLSAVSSKFPSYEFRVEGYKLMTRKKDSEKWEIMGYVMPLSIANSDKSVPFDDVDYIIFDEFILAKGMQHYIRNEVELFLDFYNTVDRLNDRVRVFLLANSVSIVNPYFLYFKITPRKGDKIRTYFDGYVAVQILASKEFEDAASSTRFGKMIAGTPYYDYAIGNEYADDTDLFICDKPSTAEPLGVIIFDNQTISIWVDRDAGLYHISGKDAKGAPHYALTRDDLTPNMILLERASTLLKGIHRMYASQNVRFTDSTARGIWYNIADYCNLR